MKEQEKDLMERYIYEVIRRVPKEQREEIAMELRELIGDMAEEASMEEVLQRLGDPAVFARQYRNENRYVIGPEYYDDYEWVLKIAGAAILLSAVVSGIVQAFIGAEYNILEQILGNAVFSLIFGFGAVTLVFAVLERQQVKVRLREEKKWKVEELGKESLLKKIGWTPDLLKPVPNKKSLIQRSDSMVSIIFTIAFLTILLLMPELFGAYVFEDGEFVRIIPVFNIEQWGRVLPVFAASLFVSLIDEMIRMVKGYYCKTVLISNVVCGGVSLILSFITLKVLPVWNPVFLEEIKQTFDLGDTGKWDLLTYYGTDLFSNVLFGIIFFAVLLEMVVTIYKTVQYGR